MKNIIELRNDLCENYNLLKSNKIGVAVAKQLANTAGKIIQSLRVEIEYNKLFGMKTRIPFLETEENKEGRL